MRSSAGSSAVELALVLPVVVLVVFAAIEVAVVAQRQLEATHAAREGAREAAANPDPAAATAAVHRALGGRAASALISVRRDHVVGGAATVEVTLPHTLGAPVFGGVAIVLKGRAVMRVER